MTASPIVRQAEVIGRLGDGMRALREGNITAGELDQIVTECRDSMAAIERDTARAMLLRRRERELALCG